MDGVIFSHFKRPKGFDPESEVRALNVVIQFVLHTELPSVVCRGSSSLHGFHFDLLHLHLLLLHLLLLTSLGCFL